MPERQQWILTVDPACSLDQVCEELVRRGFAVATLLKEIGVIVVSGGAQSRAELAAIVGVSAGEAATAIDIGPPSQPDNW
jgi:hypothetical protein